MLTSKRQGYKIFSNFEQQMNMLFPITCRIACVNYINYVSGLLHLQL